MTLLAEHAIIVFQIILVTEDHEVQHQESRINFYKINIKTVDRVAISWIRQFITNKNMRR